MARAPAPTSSRTRSAKPGKTPATGSASGSAPALNANSKAPSKPAKAAILEYSPFWLLKTEPETYAFEQLAKDRCTNWNNVRNFQARNYLRRMKHGDIALIYHSGETKAVVGLARIIKVAYPDVDAEDPGTEWVQVDIEYIEPFTTSVPLARLKATTELAELMLIRQSRLSVMPVLEPHYRKIRELGGLRP
jgi:predicted RNA-binding protein with PUA-like domain